ncbi:SUMF1/EgtB/PvdO family nonheme iron enzyme [Candidatus Bathyarchaeota archaeon]|nr:SUMF1/EgtB/PvdO family nonheme iron enzyme [Candidatus Bathyarchaeota archaeon]
MVRSRKGHRWLWACSIFVLVAVAIVTFLMFHNRPRINPYPSVKQPGKPKEGQDWTAPGIDMEFVWLPAMKCWVAKYEATNGEYRKFKPDHDSKEYKGHTLNDNRQPVVLVTYDDAVAFAEWLTKREQEAGRLSAGVKYRLPDGDEWMTFAQCGDGRQSPWGNEWPPKYGNYYGKTGGKVLDLAKELKNETFIPISDYDDGFPVTCPVEESGKNAWGLYGVGGNAWEWTNELHADKSQRILCGSSWFNFHRSTLQCAYRNPHHPSFREVYNGFRLSLFRSPAAQEQASATVSESGSTTMTSNTSDAPKPSEPVKRKPAVAQPKPEPKPPESEKTTGGPIEGQDWAIPGVGMEFVWIEALKCWVGKCEVTNGEYRKFKPDHDSKDCEGHTLNDDRQPVVEVSYDDAVAFAEWVTDGERESGRLPDGFRYRLPDGNEWTTFAQCGDGREYPWGNEWPPKYGNYADETAKKKGKESDYCIDGYDDGFPITSSVEKSGKNDWGL